jgi:hypothetical protein
MMGYLIHIDGALTREYEAVDPTIDKKLIARFEEMARDGEKVALVTARSEKWLDRHLLPLIDAADLLVLGEYGDFRVWRNQRSWDDKAQEFEGRYRELLKDRIAAIARSYGIKVKKDDRDYEPKSGELWFAPGAGVLAVRTNSNRSGFGAQLDADLVYKIAKHAVKESGVPEEEFDIKKTPVSTVISRKGVNLEQAARIAVAILDPEDYVEKWYALGRATDEAMAYDPKIAFISVEPKASKATWEFLSKIA